LARTFSSYFVLPWQYAILVASRLFTAEGAENFHRGRWEDLAFYFWAFANSAAVLRDLGGSVPTYTLAVR